MGVLGQTVAKLRKERGLSQAELSEGLCSRSHLSHIEVGNKLPSPDLLSSLAARLEVPLSQLARAYVQEPVTEAELLGIVEVLARAEDLDEAWRILDDARVLMRKHGSTPFVRARAWENEGFLHYAAGNYGEALEAWQKVLSLQKRRPSRQFFLARAYFWVGHLMIYLGDMDGAEEVLSEGFPYILAINPRKYHVETDKIIRIHEWYAMDLGYALLYKRRFAGALYIYETTFNRWKYYDILDNPDPNIRLGYGMAQLGAGYLEEAASTFAEVSERPVSPGHMLRALTNLGTVRRLQGNMAQALEYQERALRVCEEHSLGARRGVLNELARVNLALGNSEAAEVYLDRNPGGDENADPTLLVESQLLRARLARSRGQFQRAGELLDRASGVSGASTAMQSMLKLEYVSLCAQTGDVKAIPGLVSSLEEALKLVTI